MKNVYKAIIRKRDPEKSLIYISWCGNVWAAFQYHAHDGQYYRRAEPRSIRHSGGDMVDDVTFHNAVIYLCFCAPIVFLTALGMILQEVLNVQGFQTARAALGAINVAAS